MYIVNKWIVFFPLVSVLVFLVFLFPQLYSLFIALWGKIIFFLKVRQFNPI